MEPVKVLYLGIMVGVLILIVMWNTKVANGSPILDNQFQIRHCIQMFNSTLGLHNATQVCEHMQFNGIGENVTTNMRSCSHLFGFEQGSTLKLWRQLQMKNSTYL